MFAIRHLTFSSFSTMPPPVVLQCKPFIGLLSLWLTALMIWNLKLNLILKIFPEDFDFLSNFNNVSPSLNQLWILCLKAETL